MFFCTRYIVLQSTLHTGSARPKKQETCGQSSVYSIRCGKHQEAISRLCNSLEAYFSPRKNLKSAQPA